MVIKMFKINNLIKHNFFGYGIILDSNEKTSDVYFIDGPRTIMNTHLILCDNQIEYEKVLKVYNQEQENKKLLLEKEQEKIRLKELADLEKKKRKEERENRRILREKEQQQKELAKKKKQDEIAKLQQEEYEKNKAFAVYNEKLDKLSDFMHEDIYPIEKFKFYLKKNDIPRDESVIEYSLFYLGYRMRTKEVILHNKWSSIEDYFENEVSQYDRYFYHNKYNIEIYDDILKRLEKKMVLFEASPGIYITQRLMKKLGINTYTLNYFYDEINKIGEGFNIFSSKQVTEILTNNKIIEFASETKQIEKFILSTPNIKSIQADDGKFIFSFTENRFTRPMFLETIFESIQSIDIYNLKNKIEEDYDVVFNIESLIYCAENSSLYYNEEMEKVYESKKVFLKEIFNE